MKEILKIVLGAFVVVCIGIGIMYIIYKSVVQVPKVVKEIEYVECVEWEKQMYEFPFDWFAPDWMVEQCKQFNIKL